MIDQIVGEKENATLFQESVNALSHVIPLLRVQQGVAAADDVKLVALIKFSLTYEIVEGQFFYLKEVAQVLRHALIISILDV